MGPPPSLALFKDSGSQLMTLVKDKDMGALGVAIVALIGYIEFVKVRR